MAIPVPYFRSSSYNNWDFCQQQYFLNYVLGLPRGAGKKALKGTIAHKALELLAKLKQSADLNPGDDISIDDGEVGKLTISRESFLAPYVLTELEIDSINRTRINASTYKHDCKLPYGFTRYGVHVVDQLTQLAYATYESQVNDWQPVDYKDIRNWVWMALEYRDGMFDPRKRKIVEPERAFDLPIKTEWAKQPDGEYLRIKGTIDLITDIGDGVYEIVDWKTGQRLDWANDEKKDYKKLCQDFQLMLYYYAVRHLYPNVKTVVVSIFFIRDGGPFSLCFENSSLDTVEDLLYNRWKQITTSTLPEMVDPSQKDFRCQKICDYFKTPSPDGRTNMCKFLHEQVKLIGIDGVIKKHTHKGHIVSNYNAPGELKD
jgi:hypothetical protein